MKRTIHDLRKIAEEKGWILNPNIKTVQAILRSQNKFKESRGEYYCPCKKEKTEENICPCKESGNEVLRDDRCHCNLFHKHPQHIEKLRILLNGYGVGTEYIEDLIAELVDQFKAKVVGG